MDGVIEQELIDIGDKIFERYPWIEFNSYLKQLYIIYGGIGILQEITKEIRDQIYEIELYRVEKYGTRADKLIVSPEDLPGAICRYFIIFNKKA